MSSLSQRVILITFVTDRMSFVKSTVVLYASIVPHYPHSFVHHPGHPCEIIFSQWSPLFSFFGPGYWNQWRYRNGSWSIFSLSSGGRTWFRCGFWWESNLTKIARREIAVKANWISGGRLFSDMQRWWDRWVLRYW